MFARALRRIRSLFRYEPISWVGFIQSASAFAKEREEVAERLRGAYQPADRCIRCGVLFLGRRERRCAVCVGCGNPKKKAKVAA